MTKTPNTWKNNDEFSAAKRVKFEAELIRSVRERTKSRPEPKDKLQAESLICTPNETGYLASAIPAGEVLQFKSYQSKQVRQDSMFRAYGGHKARNWRLMQESADRQKRQEELQGELTES
jgi:hypothetical protein